MATINHLVRTVRTEDKSLYSGFSGDVYLAVLRDETSSMSVHEIYVNVASLDTSKFNEAPVGSKLINLHDGSMHLKTGATTWVTVSTA